MEYTNENGVTNKAYEATEIELKDKRSGANGDSEKDVGKHEDRPEWSNGLEFLMSCISMSVGLGNIWRFPFTAFENGGGAFLIPYIVVLFLVGKPVYFMEMALGQFTGRNSVRIWVVSPAMKGVGIGQLVGTLSIVTYYVSLMAITLFYLAQSFTSVLPWTYCRPEWGPDCFSASEKNNSIGIDNSNKTSSSEFYFLEEVLKQKKSIDDGIGVPDWRLTLCLLGAWIGVFLVMIKGVKSSGKVAYVLAILPYVIMITLLIRAVTLEGAVDGILYFITPNWSQLYNPQVWYAAITQSFFSLGILMGPVNMFSSYNAFNARIKRDAMIVTTLDTFTSLLAGFTIFGILGNLAHEKGVTDLTQVIGSGGTGLAFISYPDAIAKFQWVPQLFAVLFFLMLLVLGLGSAVSLHGAIVTVLADRFPQYKFWQMALAASTAGFLLGLVYVTGGGQQVLALVDKFGGTFLILGMAIFEMVGIIWIYGLENFCEDLEYMIEQKISIYWRYCWGIITPLLMSFVFIYAFADMQPLKVGAEILPDKANVAGWTLLAFGLLQLPLWMIVYFAQNKKDSWINTIKEGFKPSDKWGPKNAKDREGWLNFKEQVKRERDAYAYPMWKHIICSLNGTYRRNK